MARRKSATTKGNSSSAPPLRPVRALRQVPTQRPVPRIPAVAGFTLIELVLVLVVLAIAGVMAAPALLPALETVRAEAAIRRTASFLDDARRRAVLERKVLVVHCRPGEERLVLLGAASGEKAFQVPEAVEIVSCRPEELRYFPQGSATGMILLLRDRRGREHGLSVGTFTGLSCIDAAKQELETRSRLRADVRI